MKNSFLHLILVLVLCSCSGLGRTDYKKFLEDPQNGLIKNISLGGVEYSIKYRPLPFLYLTESNPEEYSSKKLSAYLSEHGGNSHFLLEIKYEEKYKSAISDYTAIRDTYRNTTNAKYITLNTPLKNYPCLLYHHETISSGNYKISLMFGSDVANETENFKVTYYDPVTGLEPIFEFKSEDIQNIPNVNL